MKTIKEFTKHDILERKDYVQKINSEVLRYFRTANFTPLTSSDNKYINGKMKIKNFRLESFKIKGVETPYVIFDLWKAETQKFITLAGELQSLELTKFDEGKNGGMIKIIAIAPSDIVFQIKLTDDRRRR